MIDSKKLAKLVRGEREKLNLTVPQLATKIGIQKAALYKIEGGKSKNLLFTTAMGLCEAFGFEAYGFNETISED